GWWFDGDEDEVEVMLATRWRCWSVVAAAAAAVGGEVEMRDEVEAKMVSPEVESEKWRRLLLHRMCVAIDAVTDGREEDFFPRNGK
ncbi:hypothetical protein Tco_0582860, partial [Tanacetum coccineum]